MRNYSEREIGRRDRSTSEGWGRNMTLVILKNKAKTRIVGLPETENKRETRTPEPRKCNDMNGREVASRVRPRRRVLELETRDCARKAVRGSDRRRGRSEWEQRRHKGRWGTANDRSRWWLGHAGMALTWTDAKRDEARQGET